MDFRADIAKAETPKKKRRSVFGWLTAGYTILFFSGTILILALVIYIAVGGPTRESDYVKTKQFQAVFLNNGQVYFGRVTNLNGNFIRIQNIYYLKDNSQAKDKPATGNSLLLSKLGCELHGPNDEMVINRGQVLFWENMKSDSQVVKKIDEYKNQNPNGQKCADTSQSSDTGQATTTPVKQ